MCDPGDALVKENVKKLAHACIPCCLPVALGQVAEWRFEESVKQERRKSRIVSREGILLPHCAYPV